MTGIAEDQFPMDRFDIFNVRAEGYDQRLPMLETAVRHYHPDLVILDGIPYLCSEVPYLPVVRKDHQQVRNIAI